MLGPHHSQSRIHGKFNFIDTLGWFVPWHGAVSHPENSVSNWKSKHKTSFTMGLRGAKHGNAKRDRGRKKYLICENFQSTVEQNSPDLFICISMLLCSSVIELFLYGWATTGMVQKPLLACISIAKVCGNRSHLSHAKYLEVYRRHFSKLPQESVKPTDTFVA